jgi:putative peptidoglycan lipid II flippase
MSVIARIQRVFITPTATSISMTLVVGAGAFVAKAAGFGKELVVAYKLGAGPELDAFLYAYTFPVFLVTILSGAVVASFVPRYLLTEAQSSPEAARGLASELATVVFAGTTALVLLAVPVTLIGIPHLASGFDAATKAATIRLVPVLMLLVWPNLLASLWSSLLNAHHKFAVAAFVPVITPLFVLCAIYGGLTSSGALSLSIGTVLGALVEMTIIASVARAIGFDLFRIPRCWRPEFTQVLRQFLPVAGSSLLLSVTLLVDQSFAASLAPGSVSALSYGSRLASVGASILVVAVSTIALPMFSRLAARREFLKLRRAFFTACAATVALTLPLAALLAIGAEPILDALFQRGSFTSSNVDVAASVQSLQAWHLTPYVVSIIAVRALSAICETWVLLIGSFANLAVDLFVNTVFVPSMGVAAIGMASTAVYLTSALVLSGGFLYCIRRRIATLVPG